MIDSIIEKITNQRNIGTEKKLASLFNNIRGKILYSSDELLFSTDSGDFILKQGNSEFLKDGDFVNANIKNEGNRKYLHILNKKNNESYDLEIIGYNDKGINAQRKINPKNNQSNQSHLRSNNTNNKTYNLESGSFSVKDVFLVNSFRDMFLGKKIDMQIAEEHYGKSSNEKVDFANQLKTSNSNKDNAYLVTDVKLKNKNNLASAQQDVINLTNTKNTKYCEVISLNSNKKLVTKSNEEIIIIDSKGKELPRGTIIKLESTSERINNKNSQERAFQNLSEEMRASISDKVHSLVEELKFIETIFYRVGNLISQNTKSPKEKYKSILDLLKRRFSRKTTSSFDPKSLDKLSKEIISGHELKNILEETSKSIESIKQDANYSGIKNAYQIDIDFAKNRTHVIEITEEDVESEENNRKKLIHFSIDTENLQTPLVKKLVGALEFCYNSKSFTKLELKIFQGDMELENEFKENIEDIFNKWMKSEKKDGEILFCQDLDENGVVVKNSTNHIGLRISI
jgi:hypothetical protein